jgi:hypothetical protein
MLPSSETAASCLQIATCSQQITAETDEWVVAVVEHK